MKHLIDGLAVAGGGALGAVLRWLIALTCGRWFGHSFPIATLLINLTGSFALGWFLARGEWSDTTRLAVAVGFLGAYTTFSTFTFESIALWDHAAFIRATLNVIASVVLGLIAVRVGMHLGR